MLTFLVAKFHPSVVAAEREVVPTVRKLDLYRHRQKHTPHLSELNKAGRGCADFLKDIANIR